MTLGRIVVDLLAKTGSFETDLNRSAKLADKRAREIDAAFQRAGRAIGLALAAGATAAAVALKSTIDRMDEMSKAAQKVGLPTEDFSKLTYAADLADVSMETLVSSLGKLTKSQAAALNTTSQQAKVFDALGIAVKDADGKLRNSKAVLEEFADKFQALKGSPEAMAAGFALFGRSFQEMIPLLKDGGAGIRAAGDELERMGGVLSTQAGHQAEQFNDNLTRLKTAAAGLALQVAQDLLPQMIELTENLKAITADGSRTAEIADMISTAFSGVARVVGGVATAFEQAGKIVGGQMAVFKGIYEVIAGLLSFDGAQVRIGVHLITEGAQGTVDAALNRQNQQQRKPKVTPLIITGDEGQVPDSVFAKSTGQAAAEKEAARLQAALQKAMAGGGAKKGKAKSGKSDAEREAEQLAASYKRLEDSLKEQIALHGETTEVARVRYELENGELSKLTQAQKDNLLGLAAQKDAQEAHDKLLEEGKALTESLMTPTEQLNEERAKAAKLLEAGAISQEAYNRAIERAKDPGQALLQDLQFELDLLRMTNAERATAIQLRGMDAEQVRKYGAAILDANKNLQEMGRLTELADGVRGEFVDFFTSLVDGSKSAGEALKDFFDNIAAMITRMIAEKWAEKLFGDFGSTGQGTSGGDWIGSIFGALFGGGRASGGPTMAGGTYLVGERGPELFVPRTAGTVIPAGQTAQMMGGGGVVNNAFYLPERVTRQTQEQMSQRAGLASRRALARS